MKTYKLVNGPLNYPLICISMIVLLILGRDTLIANHILGFAESQVLAIVLLGVLGIVFLLNNKSEIRQIITDQRVGVIIVAALIYILPLLLKLDFQLMYLSVFLCVVFGVFMSYIISVKNAAKIFVSTMCALTLYSVVATYLLKPLTVAGILPVEVITNSAGMTYYNYGLAFVATIVGYLRNGSLFREPGVFCFFLLLAVYLSNEYVEYKNRKFGRIITTGILSLGVITTFSTAGMIELVLLLGVILAKDRVYRHKSFWIATAVATTAALALIIYIVVEKGSLYWELYSMCIKLFQPNHSLSARLASIVGNLKMIMKHFFVGDTVVNVMYSLGDNTASTLILFAMCGVLGGLVNVLLWLVLLWRSKQGLLISICLTIVMFMTFNTQNLTTNLFFWLFPTMAFCQWLCECPFNIGKRFSYIKKQLRLKKENDHENSGN